MEPVLPAASTHGNATNSFRTHENGSLCRKISYSSGNFRGSCCPSIRPFPPNTPLRFYGEKNIEWDAVQAGRWGTSVWTYKNKAISVKLRQKTLAEAWTERSTALQSGYPWHTIKYYLLWARPESTYPQCNRRRKRIGKRWREGSNKMETFCILRQIFGFQTPRKRSRRNVKFI